MEVNFDRSFSKSNASPAKVIVCVFVSLLQCKGMVGVSEKNCAMMCVRIYLAKEGVFVRLKNTLRSEINAMPKLTRFKLTRDLINANSSILNCFY